MSKGGPDPALASLLYSALAEPIGLLCEAEPDFAIARARLYATRSKLGDPELDQLQFRASPWPEGNLVIVKSKIEVRKDDTRGSEEGSEGLPRS